MPSSLITSPMQYQQALTISKALLHRYNTMSHSHSSHNLSRAHVLAPSVRDGLGQALHEVKQAPRLDLLVQLDHAAGDEMPYGSSGLREGRVRRREENFEEEGVQRLYVRQEIILLLSTT